MQRLRRKIVKLGVSLVAVGTLGACTVVNTAVLPSGQGTPFVTTGDITGPYQSLGPLQVTRKGHLLFGFVDIVGTDLEHGFREVLVPEIRKLGGDGAINVRFHQTQYLPFTKVMQAVFFFIPFLWPNVTITAEVVKLAPGGSALPPAPPDVR